MEKSFLVKNGYMLPLHYTVESKEFMLGLQDQIQYLTVYNQALIAAIGQANCTLHALDGLIPKEIKEKQICEGMTATIQYQIDSAQKILRSVYADTMREHLKQNVKMVYRGDM